MPNPFNFLIYSLVCYRITQLISREDGPFDVFHKLRLLAGSYDYGSNGRIRTWYGRLIKCPYCLGFWVAIPLAISLNGVNWQTVLIWIAMAGMQSLLQGVSDK